MQDPSSPSSPDHQYSQYNRGNFQIYHTEKRDEDEFHHQDLETPTQYTDSSVSYIHENVWPPRSQNMDAEEQRCSSIPPPAASPIRPGSHSDGVNLFQMPEFGHFEHDFEPSFHGLDTGMNFVRTIERRIINFMHKIEDDYEHLQEGIYII